MRGQQKAAKPPYSRADGVVSWAQLIDFAGLLLRLRPIGLALRATHPLQKGGFATFIGVAATPPLRGQ
jgi:hypothetical protein